jgi:hypothetical protein
MNDQATTLNRTARIVALADLNRWIMERETPSVVINHYKSLLDPLFGRWAIAYLLFSLFRALIASDVLGWRRALRALNTRPEPLASLRLGEKRRPAQLGRLGFIRENHASGALNAALNSRSR